MTDEYIAPCGSCRQFIAEFGLDWTVVIIKNKNEYQICQVRDVLPFAFERATLDSYSVKHLKVK